MTAILEKLTLYWTYPFVRYALVVGGILTPYYGGSIKCIT